MKIILISLLMVTLSIKLSKIPSTNPPPSQRAYIVMDYDDSTNSIYISGGNKGSVAAYNEIWEFSIDGNTWHPLNPTSEIKPLARYTHGGFIDPDSHKFFIFGGNSPNGPLNDLWSFDLESFQWEMLHQTGDVPSPRYKFGFTKYKDENGALKFVIFGGCIKNSYDYNLYVLNPETYAWKKLPYNSDGPLGLNGPTLGYHNGYIYTAAGDITASTNKEIVYTRNFWRYDLRSQFWSNITHPESRYENRILSGSVIYDDYYYLFFGWSNQYNYQLKNIKRVSLLEGDYEWKDVSIRKDQDYDEIARDSFGICKGREGLYIFGGFVEYSGTISNSLVYFDLKDDQLTYNWISKEMTNPIRRLHHTMVHINTYFYTFGGENENEYYNDVWKFDTKSDTWNAVETKGSHPTPRSRHAGNSQGDIIVIFGGSDSMHNFAHNWILKLIRIHCL